MSGTIEQQEAAEAPEPRALIEAVEQGNEDEVKRLIDAGVPVDETDSGGKNALVEAVSRCNETLVHLLVKEGKAFVNSRDVYGRTPLFHAITKSKKIAKYLIEEEADVNLKDFSNRSPLSFFVEDCMMNKDIPLPTLISAKLEEFQMLRSKCSASDPSKNVTLDIQTILSIVLCKLPLMCATESKMWTNPSTPKTSLVDQETIEKTWKNFIPALKEASKHFEEKDTILEDILRKREENKPFSAMCHDTTELLVQLGADPNFADADGNTALHYAACLPWMGVSQETTKDICTQLHKFGVPLNAKNHRGQTPLLFCLSGSMKHLKEEDKVTAMKTLVEVCKFLITRGTSLEETTQDGESVFHLVIKLFQQGLEIPEQRVSKEVIHETMDILDLFSCDRLNEGITVNKRDCRLYSPLHNWATLVLPKDVDYDCNDVFGVTLKKILEHLLKVGATLNPRNENEETPLHLCKTWKAVKLLVDAGANPKDVDSSGRSPLLEQQEAVEAPEPRALIEAVEQGNEDEVKRLIDAGVPVDETDSGGKNALVEAVSHCNEALVHLLVEEGKAFVNARDVYGRTPLFYAITKSKKISKYMIEKGADVNLKDFSNRSPLSFFVEDCMMNKDIPLPTLISAKQEEFQMLTDPSKDVTLDIQTILSIVLCKLPLMCATESKMWTNPSTPKTSLVDQETIEKTWKNFIPALKEASKHFAEKDTRKNTILEVILRKCEENKPFSAMCHDTIELLVQLGADPNFADADGNTALHYAACLPWMGVSQETTKDICKQLHRFGVSPNAKNHRGQTPLLFCLSGSMGHLEEEGKVTAMKALVEVCKFLITRGSSLEETTQDGESVFHLVIKLFQEGLEIPMQRVSKEVIHETMDILDLFSCDRLNEGITVNKRDCGLYSPLHNWATLVLPKDVDYDCNDVFGVTLKNILEYLLKVGATLNPRNENEETPLHLCKTSNAVKLLVDAGANPTDVDSSGSSPLLTAAKNKELLSRPGCFYPDGLEDPEAFWKSVTEKGLDPLTFDYYAEFGIYNDKKGYFLSAPLLDRHKHVDSINTFPNEVLFDAVQQSDNETWVRKLIDARADVNGTDNEGKTALFLAVQQSNSETVARILIAAAADVNRTDNDNKTALFYAVQERENESVVRALVDGGAEVNITDNEGKTALFYAVNQGNERIVQALIDFGADVHAINDDGETALFYAVNQGNERIVQALIDFGADVHAINDDEETALFYAVNQGNVRILQALIDFGADVNAINEDGETALFYAVNQGNERILQALIDFGADVNAINEDGETALFYAVNQGNERIVQALIDFGADVHASNIYGETALFYLKDEQNIQFVHILSDSGFDINEFNKVNEDFRVRWSKVINIS